MRGSVIVRRDDAQGRYELLIDEQLAAYVELHRDGTTVVLPHTYTLPSFRGRGLAAQVVRAALDDLAAQGATVVPACWFVAEFIDANPEYRHLLGGSSSGD